ncbi:MAG TPA: TetR/AcrR family transcriptional regulator [Vicinamibacterales bacterium]|jgi:AcrR family transcriptional regulator
MTQYLKSDVRARIDDAALEVFAREGVERATMAAIARAAGISTGNVYHYYRNKNDLFQAVVGDTFVRQFQRLLRRRIKTLDGVPDVRTLGAGSPFHVAAEELLAFGIEHRLRVVILLGRAAGTRHAGFGSELVRTLQRLAVAHFRGLEPALAVTPALRSALERIYRHWVDTLVEILVTHQSSAAIREAVGLFSAYHLAGLEALFGARAGAHQA